MKKKKELTILEKRVYDLHMKNAGKRVIFEETGLNSKVKIDKVLQNIEAKGYPITKRLSIVNTKKSSSDKKNSRAEKEKGWLKRALGVSLDAESCL